MTKYVFPSDEGRHIGENESWWFGSFVTSKTGDVFFICALFVIRNNDERLIQAVTVKEIGTGMLYSNLDEHQKETYMCDLNELNIDIGHNEKWYTTGKHPFSYRLVTRITDDWYDISLNLNIKSIKGPTIQDTLGAINGILNQTAYYDHTNCEVSSELTLFNQVITVQGTGYISREWGDVLGGDWQWSAVQLDNEYEICAAKFQHIDGVKDEAWLVNPDGMVKTLTDLKIKITGYSSTWWSEEWYLQSDEGDFNLTISLMSDLQKVIGLNEGVCSVNGRFKEDDVEGICFSEQAVRFPNN